METKQLYADTVKSVNNHLVEYKTLISCENLLDLERVKQQLVADKAILRQIEVDASGLYLEAKDTFEWTKAQFYKEARSKGDGSLDATNEAKFASIPHSKKMHEAKCQRDKCRGLLDDLTNVIIEIQIKLKDSKQQIRYGQ